MLQLKKYLKIAIFTALVVLTNPLSLVKAQTPFDTQTFTIDYPGPKFDLQSGIAAAIKIVIGFVGILAFFMLLWGGVQWILAGGDKEGTEKARKRITGALIGLVIVFSAYALIIIMGNLFNFKPFDITLPALR